MLAFFRRYTKYSIFIILLIFIGLVFLSSNASSNSQKKSSFKIDRVSYSYSDLGYKSAKISQELGFNRFLTLLGGSIYGFQPRFFAENRILIRIFASSLGIRVSDDEVSNLLQNYIFVDEKKNFNLKLYESYIKIHLKNLGFNEEDLHQLIKDQILLEKIIPIIVNSSIPLPPIIRDIALWNQQKVDFLVVKFPYEDQKIPSIEKEELQEFWRKNQLLYADKEKRTLFYFTLKNSDSNRKKIAQFLESSDSEGFQFSNFATRKKFPVKTLKNVSKDSLPPLFHIPSSDNPADSIADYVFAFPLQKLSIPILSKDGNLFCFWVDSKIPAKVKSFEEVASQVKNDLMIQKKRKLAFEQANQARLEVLDLQNQEFSFSSSLENKKLSASSVPKEFPQYENLLQIAKTLPENQFSKVLYAPKNALFLYVKKRTIPDSISKENFEKFSQNIRSYSSYLSFRMWLNSFREKFQLLK